MESTNFDGRFERVDPSVPPVHPAPEQPTQRLMGFVFLLLLSVALAGVAKYALPAQVRAMLEGPDIWRLSGVATLLAAVATSIVLHEAGHLVAALLMKFQILGVALGPFRVARASGIWRFRFNARTLFSGSVSAVPYTLKGWRWRMLVVVAAGPVATLVSGVGVVALRFAHFATPLPNTFLGGVAQLSVFIFVLGLIPNGRNARVRNDARLLLVLIHHSGEAREILLYHLLTRVELAGVRPRDYPEPLLRELSQQQGRPDLMLFASHKIALWALDRGQLASADAWDRRCLDLSESCQPVSRNIALAQSAYFDVILRNRPHDAGGKLAEIEWKTLSPSWLHHRARAVDSLVRGKVPECLAELSRAQYAFPSQAPIYAFERDLLSQLYRKAVSIRPPELSKASAA